MPYTLTTPDGQTVTYARVTEVIRKVLARPALHEWEIKGAVEYACRVGGDPVTVLRDFRRQNRTAADRGTRIHAYAAAVLTGTTPPALLSSDKGYAWAFTNWLADNHERVAMTHVEQTLCRPWGKVAGTADALGERLGVRTVFDWKTVDELTDDPSIDQVAQIGAYASMTCLVADGKIIPAETLFIGTALVVQLAGDGTYREHEVEILTAVDLWDAILDVYRVLRRIEQDRQ